METVLIIVGAAIALALLLYLARNTIERRRTERKREIAKAQSEAEGHRSMAADHEQKAEELRDAAGVETERAQRHAQRAEDVQPKR